MHALRHACSHAEDCNSKNKLKKARQSWEAEGSGKKSNTTRSTFTLQLQSLCQPWPFLLNLVSYFLPPYPRSSLGELNMENIWLYITCLIWNTNTFFFVCAKINQLLKLLLYLQLLVHWFSFSTIYMLLLNFLLLFIRTLRLCFPHNKVIETAPWELIGEVNVLSSSTSIVAFTKHLSYHLSRGILCGVGLE